MINQSDIDERIAKCNKILDENPSSQIFAALAEAHRKKGDIDKAFRICQNGLKVHPNYGSAHIVMAKINMDKGLYDWAETEIEKAISIDGSARATELLLSEIHIYKGEFNKACRLLEKLHQTDPNNEQIKKLLNIARKIPLSGQHFYSQSQVPRTISPSIPSPPGPDTPPPPASSSSITPIDTAPSESTEVVGVLPPIPGEISLDDEQGPQKEISGKEMFRSLMLTPGIDGVILVNADGLVIESDWNIDGETDLLAALTAETARICSGHFKENGLGDIQSIMIESKDSLIYMAQAGVKLLAVVCGEGVNLGSLKLKLNSLLPRLSE